MQSRYVAAISAGIVGGVLLAGYAIVSFVLSLIAYNAWVPGINMLSGVCGCLLIPAVIVLAAITGVLAVMWAKAGLAKLADAAVIAAVAGAIAGLIYAVIKVVIAFLTPILMFGTAVDTSDLASGVALGGLFGAGSGVLACICAPLWLIAIAIVAAIGGAIYGSVKLKLN